MKFKQYKQFWFLLIKLSIVVGAGFYIYKQIATNNQFQSKEALASIQHALFSDWRIIGALLGMTLLNWLFEILKWQTLVSSIKKLTFHEALSQSLSSHTLSIITPFKAGEYGGKALYYTKVLRKKIVLLNFIGNLAQLLITISAGFIGIYFFVTNFNIEINPHKIRRIGYIVAFLILALFSGRSFYNKKEAYYQRALSFFKKLPSSIKLKTLFYSFLRYLLFSHQFYFLLQIFNVEVPYLTAMMLIFSMYFIATMVPVFSLFDFVIKGSIAIYLFSYLQVDEITIMIISTLLWIFNFALPALLGSYYILVFKPDFKTKFA